MVITDKKYLDNSGLIKTLENLNEQFNGIPLKKLLDARKSAYYLFYKYKGTSVDNLIKYDDTSSVTSMENMFVDCSNLTTIPLLDTSKVTSMSDMFVRCSALTSIPLLDTSKVVNMYQTFTECSRLTTIPLLDTSKVTFMHGTFSSCRSLTTIPQLDTSKVTDMSYMFRECPSLTTIPQLDTSKVTNMRYMFYNCANIEQIHMIHISTDLDISSCTKMEREALLEVLGNLKDLTGLTSKKLTLGSTLLAKLTEEDKLIATNKNRTLA